MLEIEEWNETKIKIFSSCKIPSSDHVRGISGLNVCSQKGLVEMFDASIGAGSVFMPYGGKYQLTETQAMVAKLPVLKGSTDTVTMMSYGFDPYLSSWLNQMGTKMYTCKTFDY